MASILSIVKEASVLSPDLLKLTKRVGIRAAKKINNNTVKTIKPKVHKNLGGVFGPGSFK